MAVKIKLQRIGKKKKPLYRIVAVDSARSFQGRVIQKLGSYNPQTDPPTAEFKSEELVNWLNKGATLSSTVAQILARSGLRKKTNSSSAIVKS